MLNLFQTLITVTTNVLVTSPAAGTSERYQLVKWVAMTGFNFLVSRAKMASMREVEGVV